MPTFSTQLMFVLMVFIAAFMLVHSLAIRSVDQKTAKRIRNRMKAIAEQQKDSIGATLLKDKYLSELPFLDRLLRRLPGIPALQQIIEQSGRTKLTVSRFLFLSLSLMGLSGLIVWFFRHDSPSALIIGLLAGALPFFVIRRERNRRLERFEEQLPEALDIIVRALRSGYPFNETLRAVADEMDDPLRSEFAATFTDINYGMDVRIAFLNLLERAPSSNLLSAVTAVLIQRETGGNLAEILQKISALIRARFKFDRRVRTLSAEARLSAWILSMLPFVTAVAIQFTTPSYLPMLIQDPQGPKVITVAFVLMMLGLLWFRRLIARVMDI